MSGAFDNLTADLKDLDYGNLPWLKARTILLVLHGSHAYGLATPSSDVDLKGVAIPPSHYFHGFDSRFEQAESHEPDWVIYDVRKFFSLAVECNPNVIEVLWGDESNVIKMVVLGRILLDNKKLFVSKKARHTFSGYAIAQLKRIKTHHRWLSNPPAAQPTRVDHGLLDRTVMPADQLKAAHAAVMKKLDAWNLDDMSGVAPADRIRLQGVMAEMLAEYAVTSESKYMAAGRAIGLEENFLRLLDLERQYKAKKVEWEQYQNWIATRNPARAELERKSGYDTKHAMHLVRLMRMAREIAETGDVVVRRPDREELLAIRNGAWSYEELLEWAERSDAELKVAYDNSTLPNHPDRKKLDALCIAMVEASFR